MPTVVESIATGNPPYTRSQSEAAAFMQRVTSLPAGLRQRIPALYERSGIERRYSCVSDYLHDDADSFSFYPKEWSLNPAPTTGARNRLYRESVVPLAEDVASKALQEAGRAPGEVTHVVVASCTGFFAPGLDVELVRRLGLPPSTKRTLVGFMGCYAAFNALRVADGFCRSDPDAVVLVLCAELCTLHFQVNDTLESAVVNALFSDGAAAAVLSSRVRPGTFVYLDNHTGLDEDSMEDMTWEIGDAGFLMGLSSRVPKVIAKNLPAYLDTLLSRNDVRQEDVGFWALHPGGRAIVEKTQEVLSLGDEAVEDSFAVLRDYGNMSSPTILFVLKRFLDRHQRGETLGHGVAMAFGPGLTIEGALLKGA